MPLLRAARMDGWGDLVVVADRPALDIVRAEGFDVIEAGIGEIKVGDARGREAAVARARALLCDLSADAVLASSSGPGSGIDEALTAAIGEERSFVLQDSWGDVNESFGVHAGHYFVLDNEAAEITKKRVKARVIVSGMPKYDAYAEFDILAFRDSGRRSLAVGADEILISFFAQPLTNTPGYSQSIRSVIECAAGVGDGTHFMLRPHPKDSFASIEEARELATARGMICSIVEGGAVEPVLAASDIVISAYSMCCYDSIVMGACAPKPLNAAVYFLTGPVWRTYCESTRLDDLPPVRAGVALLARSESELRAQIAAAGRPRYREEIWERIRSAVPRPGGAARRILDTIALALQQGQRKASAMSIR